MKRKFTSYEITDFDQFKSKLLGFEKKFSNFCFLDNHNYDFDKSFECIAACGVMKSIIANEENNFRKVDRFKKENDDWLFGHVSYDIKNEIENLSSKKKGLIGFPDFYFFVPEIIIILAKGIVEIGICENKDSKKVFDEITSIIPGENIFRKPNLKSRFPKSEYLKTVEKLQQHIARGDCYEICFCQDFFEEDVQINPVNVFQKLSRISPNPFSAFYKLDEKYLLCASPERFLKKIKNTIISQPIKGTSKRNNASADEDEKEKKNLQSDQKERAENIMIVDLVRNDLSKICAESSVIVKEFLAIYSFPQVHQMISTIVGKLRGDVSFSDIFYATFPMGSMTGAPKKRVLELIEKYEKIKRGLFSGTVGYINPEGNFDFNVVIRSILYNEKSKYLSVPVGSAITWKSNAEKEFEECLIKIEGMKKALE